MSTPEDVKRVASQLELGKRYVFNIPFGPSAWTNFYGTVAAIDAGQVFWAKRQVTVITAWGSAQVLLKDIFRVLERPRDAPSAPSPPPDAPFAAWLSQHPGVEAELVRGPLSSSRDEQFEREKADMLGRREA